MIDKVSKLLLSSAALVLAAAALVYAVRHDAKEAHAVACVGSPLPATGMVFTQSADGAKLYTWEWVKADKTWKHWVHDESGEK